LDNPIPLGVFTNPHALKAADPVIPSEKKLTQAPILLEPLMLSARHGQKGEDLARIDTVHMLPPPRSSSMMAKDDDMTGSR